jgi:hypothetical protein
MYNKIYTLDDWQRLDMLISLKKLALSTPNDQELGKEIRDIFQKVDDYDKQFSDIV